MMLPFMKIHGAQFFLQDSAPCHTSKLVTNRLKEIEDESKVLDWCGNTQDLNLIENCWPYINRSGRLRSWETTSLPELISVIETMWVADLLQQYFLTLAHSKRRRFQAVLDNKGQITKWKYVQ
jgi:hypothetical protein